MGKLILSEKISLYPIYSYQHRTRLDKSFKNLKFRMYEKKD